MHAAKSWLPQVKILVACGRDLFLAMQNKSVRDLSTAKGEGGRGRGTHFNHSTCACRSSGCPSVVRSPACSSTSPSGIGVVCECVSEMSTKRTHSSPVERGER